MYLDRLAVLWTMDKHWTYDNFLVIFWVTFKYIRTQSVLGLGIWTLAWHVNYIYENHNIAIAMSSSRAESLLWLNILSFWAFCRDLNIKILATALARGIKIYKSIPLHWLGLFKYLNQCHCTGWWHLNVYISHCTAIMRLQDMMWLTYLQTHGHSQL